MHFSCTTAAIDGGYGCGAIASITLPSTLSAIGEYAFEGQIKLININIPSSVSIIGGGFLSQCTDLQAITVDSGNTAFFIR